jgi:large subunit ribosomal protein L17
MATHQSGRKRLNLNSDHRRSLIRNQVAVLVKHGSLKSTRARVKVVQRFVEKLVTIARGSTDFNTIRAVRSKLPYDLTVVKKLVYEIAPKYIGRPGGYTRVLSLGTRPSDTAKIARLEWV